MPASLLHLVRIGLAALLLVGTPARADTYTYDVLGNLSTLSSDRGTRSFTYDELNRLKTEAGFTGTRAHAYDANTNRSTNGAAPPTLVTYTPASNRIATLNGLAVTFDAAGNLLADDLYTYTWDEVGRLKTVSKSGTLLATYAYDHRNRRSRKTTTAAAPQGAQTILYHYDQDDHLIAETRSDGTPLRTYAWLGELPITIIEHAALSTPPRTLHLQHDHLGTPRLAKNDAGIIQWRWDSDGYGASTPSQDPDGDGKYTSINLRFPGQYYDLESGLHYNWNRYYSPRLGRYLSPDPIGIEGGSNAYAYVDGNPLRYSDPNGLQVIPLPPIPVPGVSNITAGANKTLAQQLDRLLQRNGDDDPKQTYQTYTRYNPQTGKCYSGRTSGYDDPQTNIRNRALGQPLLNAEGFLPPVLDRSTDSYSAIRGREQMLIETNGGAQSVGGTSRNKINGISPINPRRLLYLNEALLQFGAPTPSANCTCQ